MINQEKARLRKQKYKNKNAIKLAASSADYRNRNRERIRITQAEYRNRNHERIDKLMKERRHVYNHTRNETYRRRFFYYRCRHIEAGPEREVFALKVALLWVKQRGICSLTGSKLGRDAQLDHIFPKSKGGTDEISNLRWVSRAANLAKSDMLDHELIELCKSIIKHNQKKLA
jgi:5-methylcytosine-specific restriction endonuclease McrA